MAGHGNLIHGFILFRKRGSYHDQIRSAFPPKALPETYCLSKYSWAESAAAAPSPAAMMTCL